MHSLLERHLRKLGLDPDAPELPSGAWTRVRERFSRLFATADQECYLLERSLNLVSEEMSELYEQLKTAAEERYLNLFGSANDLIFTVDLCGCLTSVNRACEEISGYSRDELVGRSAVGLFVSNDGSVIPEMFAPGNYGREGERFEVDLIARDGRHIPLEISGGALARRGEPYEILGVGRDIGERRAHEEHLLHLARHDALTGLPNRTVLQEAVAEAVEDAQHGQQGAVALLDIDNFKLINDTFGHAAGDQVLLSVANLLRICLPDALIARHSGDEFAFVLRDTVPDDAVEAAEQVRRVIEQADIRHGSAERVVLSASIGIVPIEAASHPAGLLAEADAAMYVAKEEGRNRVFWSGVENAITGRFAEVYHWATALRSALEMEALEVHYQPIVDLNSGNISHYEVLVRLREPDGTLVLPGAFLPAAERFGLTPAIDRFVLGVAIDHLRRDAAARIFVNLSAATLADRELLSHIITTLRTEPSLRTRLGFEITETVVLRDIGLAKEWMDKLRAVGCEFALDDFGTGFNSLTYVRLLPLSQIKIDGSFILAISTDPKQRAVAAAVKVLADGLGMQTVAEWVESTESLEALRALGIQYGQGSLLGNPSAELLGPRSAAA